MVPVCPACRRPLPVVHRADMRYCTPACRAKAARATSALGALLSGEPSRWTRTPAQMVADGWTRAKHGWWTRPCACGCGAELSALSHYPAARLRRRYATPACRVRACRARNAATSRQGGR